MTSSNCLNRNDHALLALVIVIYILHGQQLPNAKFFKIGTFYSIVEMSFFIAEKNVFRDRIILNIVILKSIIKRSLKDAQNYFLFIGPPSRQVNQIFVN